MIKAILKTITAVFIFTNANSQITKGNWMFGGNIAFSSYKFSGDLGSRTDNVIEVVGNAGYFFIDRLAAGIKPNVYFDNTKNNATTNRSNRSSIGPFLRYYFLPSDNKTNLFAEGSYAYGITTVNNQNATHSNSFSFIAGPVFFLTPSVGLELSVGYAITNNNNNNTHTKLGMVQTLVGLQFHLEKE